MKERRKQELLHSFPPVPDDILNSMKGRGAQNFVVMLVKKVDGELFARCFHRYTNGQIVERQRYVFAKDGAVRYGKDDGKPWTIRKEFREPVFCQSGYGYTFDNSYCVMNYNEISRSCMKYARISGQTSSLFMEYLGLYCRHPNVEYLMKTGYDFLISEEYDGYWGTHTCLSVSPLINWKSNDLRKMLSLTKTEFKSLQGRETIYPCYMMWKKAYPKYSIEELIRIASVFRYEQGTAELLEKQTELKLRRIARYLSENNVNVLDYSDYIDQCIKLKYDLHDTAVSMPHNFLAMHTRLSNIIKYGNSEGLVPVFRQNMEQRRQLEFEGDSLFIRQPESFEEIVAEGNSLSHCVGGYAERHALGKLHIMFIRKKDEPEKPYYTMEVSISGKIIQVRGDRNCAPTEEVSDLIEMYKAHLETLYDRKGKMNKRCQKAAERANV